LYRYIVELTGGVAILADPSKVFPGIAFAGVECSQWYGLTLCCVALMSYLAANTRAAEPRDGVAPVVGGMCAYHVGIAGFQVRMLIAGAAGAGAGAVGAAGAGAGAAGAAAGVAGAGAGAGVVIAAGALSVHAPLAVLFAAAVLYCYKR
jgi:hypothetical protein